MGLQLLHQRTQTRLLCLISGLHVRFSYPLPLLTARKWFNANTILSHTCAVTFPFLILLRQEDQYRYEGLYYQYDDRYAFLIHFCDIAACMHWMNLNVKFLHYVICKK